MAESNMKGTAKRLIKKSLVATKNTLRKNKHILRAGKTLKNVLFPPGTGPNHYDIHKYYPAIPEYLKQVEDAKNFKYKPLISIVMPTYNTPDEYLRECLDSVITQSYSNWEFCIADDASPNKQVVKTLKEYAQKDKRIKYMVRKKNGHISAASNSGIELATGEYIALLDHDDILWPNSLFEIAKRLNENPKIDFIYTDEDKIDAAGTTHSYPFFKPDWSPEFLESCNYITHFSCIRTSLIREVGGFRVGYEGAQDWDLFLRVTEKTNNISHIAKVLYSWRVHEASTAMSTDAKPYVYEAQRKLLAGHIERSGREAQIKQGIIKQHCSIEYKLEDEPLVTVIICGRSFEHFKRSVASILKHDSYRNIEVLLAAADKKSFAHAERLARSNPKWKVLRTASMSPAAAYNKIAALATGEYLVFVDGAMTVHTPRWLQLLLSDAQRDGVGVVGGKTLYRAQDRIMRAGIALGIYGLYAPLLEGMSVDDVHYMRGLYAQSRRNSAAVDSGCTMISRGQFKDLGGFNEAVDDMFMVDLCLRILQKGQRIVYNPFIETIDLRNLTAGDADKARDAQAMKVFQKKWAAVIEDDPYFNPAFTRTNAQLEIK